jgi:diacylglycerol kinase (ATP)
MPDCASQPRSERVRVLVNPAAGRGAGRKALPRLQGLAQEDGLRLVVSRGLDELSAEAERAVAEGVERLLVAGGDGTMHHAVQALAGSETALGVLALGSGNDLAATVGVPRRLEAAFRTAVEGPVRTLDLGRVEDRWYAGVAGVGIDSEVAHIAAERVRLLRGPLIYPWAVVRALATFRPPLVSLEYERAEGGEGRFEGRVMLVAFGNTHRFGGGMCIAPEAEPDDGWLDVVIVREMPRRRLLRVFPKVYRGGHMGLPQVESFRTRRMRVWLEREMTVYGDGEPMTPVTGDGVEVRVVPGALKVAGPG